MYLCKDGRIWGQNNKEAGGHLGISITQPYIKKGHNPNSIGRPFKKGYKICISLAVGKKGIQLDPRQNNLNIC